ncbi:MAG TPA: zf-HC2 domain-containing protein [Vicinamibacteria bacterium]|nr:zf-HC2 domain-containing protein [Vicinamibacteria bacterium]
MTDTSTRIERRTWRCPDETLIAAYAQSGLAGRDKDRLEAHLADCEVCVSQVAFLLKAQEATGIEPAPDWLVKRARAMGTQDSVAPLLRWAMAGGVVLAITGAFWLYQSGGGSGNSRTVRGGNEASLEILRPREGAVLPNEGLEFQWEEAEGALFYEINLVTTRGDLLWQSRVDDSKVRLPSGMSLAGNEKYYVWVRAHLSDRGTIKSETVAFEVRAKP